MLEGRVPSDTEVKRNARMLNISDGHSHWVKNLYPKANKVFLWKDEPILIVDRLEFHPSNFTWDIHALKEESF
jgi:hypothetical protein